VSGYPVSISAVIDRAYSKKILRFRDKLIRISPKTSFNDSGTANLSKD